MASALISVFVLLVGPAAAEAQDGIVQAQAVRANSNLPVEGAILSDSFDRANAASGALGNADNALGGSGTHGYASVFSGNLTQLISGALQNTGQDFSGVQIVNASRSGENLGQDMNIRMDLTVPGAGSGLSTQAGPYLRARAASVGDGIIGGTNAGYWVQLWSTGEIKIKNLNTGQAIASTAVPTSFDSAKTHTLDLAAKGDGLQVSLDGRLQTFNQNGAGSATVKIPATGGSNTGVIGIAFAAENNRGKLGGQRADNLVVYAYKPLTTLTASNTPTPGSPTTKPTDNNNQPLSPTKPPATPPAIPNGNRTKGDYNGDGKLTALDALAASKMALGSIDTDFNLDMNDDNSVDAEDAILILDKAVGATRIPGVAATTTIAPSKGGEMSFHGTGMNVPPVKITVPPGAIQGQKQVSLNVSLAPDPGSLNALPVGSADNLLRALGPTIQINPSTPPVFNKPIQVTVPLDPERLPLMLKRDSIAVLVSSTDSFGKRNWEIISNVTIDEQNNQITFPLNHLSEASAIAQDGAEDLVKDMLFMAVDEVGGYILDKYGAPFFSMRARNFERALVGERIKLYGELGNSISANGIDPMLEYIKAPGDTDEKLDAAFWKLMESARDIYFPEVGLAIKAGKVVIGTAQYTVEQMFAAGEIQKRDTLIAGPSGTRILSFMEPMRDNSFFEVTSRHAYTRNGQAIPAEIITAENVAEKIQSEAELKNRWTYWRSQLSLPTIQRDIDAAWPNMLSYWKAKRAIVIADKLEKAVKEKARQLAREFEKRRDARMSGVYIEPEKPKGVIYKLQATPGISHSPKPSAPVTASINATSATYSYPEPMVERVTDTVSWTLPPEIEPGHSYAVGFKTTVSVAKTGLYKYSGPYGEGEEYPVQIEDPFFMILTVFGGPQFSKDTLALFQYSPDDGKTWKPPILTSETVREKYWEPTTKQALVPIRTWYNHRKQYTPYNPANPMPATTAPEESWLEFRLTPGYAGEYPDKIYITMTAQAAGKASYGGYSVASITFTYLKQ